MPGWGEILKEVHDSAAARAPLGLGPDFDGICLKYIERLRDLSKRAIIVYASGWLAGQPGNLDYSVRGADVHALMENCRGVQERELDLVLHSPGGSPEAAEQMVNYLRTQFDYIRAIVPLQAKSAATMIALGCDEVVMGSYSELGPIDPQILVPVPEGQRFAPAHAILRDFERAKKEIGGNVAVLAPWTPILRSYAGGLIEYCTQQVALSQDIVAGWLADHMLAHPDAGVIDTDRKQRAREIAEYFSSETAYDRQRTHGRPIRVEELEKVDGLRVRRLEADKDLQDAVLSIYHIISITLSAGTLKLVENHLGARYVTVPQVTVQAGPSTPMPTAPPAPSPGPAVPGSPRAPRPKRQQPRNRRKKR